VPVPVLEALPLVEVSVLAVLPPLEPVLPEPMVEPVEPDEPVVLPVVPLAPMLLVPLPVVPEPLAEEPVVPEPLEPVVEPRLLPLPDVPLPVAPVVPVVLPEPVVPEPVAPVVPEPLVELPEVWATANPPMARAAAAASVVRVFLVVDMSNSLNGNPEGSRLKKAGAMPTASQPTFPCARQKVGLRRHSL
jgi:hypothetical protein